MPVQQARRRPSAFSTFSISTRRACPRRLVRAGGSLCRIFAPQRSRCQVSTSPTAGGISPCWTTWTSPSSPVSTWWSPAPRGPASPPCSRSCSASSNPGGAGGHRRPDLRDVSLRHWREQIAWVPQRPYLVRGTIADNLRIGDGHAGEDAVARAVALCGLSDLVAQLPLGLATPVGEGGLTLSAGERQRIALGRAVLRDAPLVLLDEPTAHVDTAREEALRDALSPWLEGRTVVVAAHRSGLVGRVDRIVHLVGGHLVDMPGSIDVRSAGGGKAMTSTGSPSRSAWCTFRYLLRVGAAPRKQVLLAAGLAVGGALTTVALMACSGALIDKAALRPPLYTLTVLMAAVQLLALARGPLRYGERLVSHDTTLRALGRLRLWLYDEIEPRSPAGLRLWHSGDVLARATGDVDALEDLYLRGILPLLTAAAVGGGGDGRDRHPSGGRSRSRWGTDRSPRCHFGPVLGTAAQVRNAGSVLAGRADGRCRRTPRRGRRPPGLRTGAGVPRPRPRRR